MTRTTLIVTPILIVAVAAAGYALMNDDRGGATGKSSVSQSDPVMRPVFSLNDIDGQMRSITEWDGNALVVNFWATWCAPCRREIPVLIEMQTELSAQNIQFIGVAIDEPAAVREYATEMPFNYPILVGEMEGIEAAEAFGADVVGMPLTVFTDHAGYVIEIHAGEINRKEITAILKKLKK